LENTEKRPGALLCGLCCTREKYTEFRSDDATIDELSALADTAGYETAATLLQQKDVPDSATVLGKGKVEELREAVTATEAEIVIFDNQLSPSQIKNLEDICGVPVIDRNMLILEIFAMHATTSEGKLQVQMALLKYTAPRLTGKGQQLSRQGGGGGGGAGARRGAGESQLETDKRKIKEQISAISAQLEEIAKNRMQQRKQRDLSGIPKVAVIGYTNAGKSTLLNTLTGAGVLAENKLFATLDPTTRRLKLDNGFEVLLTDTVGFIRNLPHQFIQAFASTLDEVKYADLLINVVDASDPYMFDHIEVTENLVEKLGAGHIPIITALNKCDVANEKVFPAVKNSVSISAKHGDGVADLVKLVFEKLTSSHIEAEYIIPYDQGSVVDKIYADVQTTVIETEYRDNGTYFKLLVSATLAGKIERYRI